MRGKKTDPIVKAKIIEEKINTFGSARDIEQSTGIPHETVAKVLREDFAQVCTESEKIAKLIDSNDKLLNLADEWIEKLTVAGEAKVSELVQVKKVSWEQNQVMKGKPTENHLVKLEEVTKLSDTELNAILKTKLQ